MKRLDYLSISVATLMLVGFLGHEPAIATSPDSWSDTELEHRLPSLPQWSRYTILAAGMAVERDDDPAGAARLIALR
ncbi:hypothetical protein XM38_047870 [Halomicronema hongdechloris C2206]|uniref:Uncharacterized protein n=1 Tax=Halomicronema hongdechloris C2206 TaxID=1641165 RepID=A0A1Z3HU26_9CYAN|nr:hypothetical protein [Halomicronema hongdechloris]ASC73814.1 hypothetical protein XM38_047870 [Halomicronema hongdechloris C2206]